MGETEESSETHRLAAIGDWFETAFRCRFGPHYFCPTRHGPTLLGMRLRLQYEDPSTDEWVTWEANENGSDGRRRAPRRATSRDA
jgi:hypothetical protein